MFFLLPCPNCWPRDVSEFRYGGQIARAAINLPESQHERWYHRCGCWLVVERDVRTKMLTHIAWFTGNDPLTEKPEGAPHDLEPEDLRALTLEASLITGLPLAGTNVVFGGGPGWKRPASGSH